MSSPTDEKDNYIRLSTLLIDGGTKLLRDVFNFICPSWDLQHYLTGNRLLLERILHQDQVEILYPADGSQARLENCDITLLLILFENVMHVCSRRPGKPWAYSTLELNLKLLRLARNKVVAHVPNLSLDADVFERHWSEITSVMIQLAQIIDQESDWEHNIRWYHSAALTSEGEKCVAKLVEWRERDEYFGEKLDRIEVKVEETNQEIKKLQSSITLEGLRKRRQAEAFSCDDDDDCSIRSVKSSKTLEEAVEYKPGDNVRIKRDVELHKRLQEGQGGWNDAMEEILGCIGEVLDLKENGDLIVEVKDSIRVFNPEAVTKVDVKEEDEQSAESESHGLSGFLRKMLGDSSATDTDPVERLAKAARNGSLSVVRDILEVHQQKVNNLTREGNTALQLACHGGHASIVKFLLDKGAKSDILDYEGYTALHHAAFGDDKNGEVLEVLRGKGIDPNSRNPKRKRTPLHLAVYQENDAAVKMLVEWPGCNVNVKDEDGKTPLLLAIENSRHKMIEILINSPDLDMAFISKGNFNYLHYASKKGDQRVVHMLLAKCPDLINVQKDDGFTALHLAALNDHCEVVKVLCGQPFCDVNVQNNDGESPLHLAVQEGFLFMVELLIEHGADVNVKDKDGDTGLHRALRKTRTHSSLSEIGLDLELILSGRNIRTFEKISFSLVHHGAMTSNLNNNGKSPMDECDDKDLIAELAARGVGGSEPQLPTSSYNGREQLANVSNDADTDRHEGAGKTAFPRLLKVSPSIDDKLGDPGERLALASLQGHFSVVKDVLDEYPDEINHVGKIGGKTALQSSCHGGCQDIVKLLLDMGAETEKLDEQGYTALHHAAYGKGDQVAVLQMLLHHGVDPNARNPDNNSTPLHLAVKQDNLEAVKMLVRWPGCDVNIQDEDSETPLFVAISQRRNEMTGVLIDASRLDSKLLNGRTMNYLQFAALKGHVFAVRKLLEKCPELLNFPKDDGFTPLHLAAFNDNCEVAALLCGQHHCERNKLNNDGQSPLHLAVMKGYPYMVEVLVDGGADINIKDRDGDTSLHLALNKEKFLKMAGSIGKKIGESKTFADMAGLLVRRGADVHQLNDEGDSPFDLCDDSLAKDAIVRKANTSRHAEKECKDSRAKKDPKKEQKKTSHTAGHEVLEQLLGGMGLGKLADPSERLVLAAGVGELSVVMDILEDHPDKINKVAKKILERTALQMSCRYGRYDVVSLLLSKGADPTKSDKQGHTALHHAAIGDDDGEAVQVLLQHGVNPNTKDKKGKTPLHLAAKHGNAAATRKLIQDKDCDVNIKNKKRETPLFVAIRKMKLQVINILISAPKLDETVVNQKKFGYLHAACQHPYAVKMLLAKFPQLINVQKDDGFTALHLAAFNDECEVAKVLCGQGCDVNIQNCLGENPLHKAVEKGYVHMASVLIDHGANVNAQDKKGDTALHVSMRMENDPREELDFLFGVGSFGKMTEYLLHHGANVRLCNARGESPLNQCEHSKHQDLIIQKSRE